MNLGRMTMQQEEEWMNAVPPDEESRQREIDALRAERAEIDAAYKAAEAEKNAATDFGERIRIANRVQVPMVDRDVLICLRLLELGVKQSQSDEWKIVDERNGGRLGQWW